MRTPAALQNLFNLSSSVKVYVPGTQGVAGDMSAQEHARHVDAALSQLGGWFGGATAYRALGSWVSPDLGLVKETVTIVESYCSEEALQEHAAAFVSYAEALKAELHQEAVSVEVNNVLYFV